MTALDGMPSNAFAKSKELRNFLIIIAAKSEAE